MVAIKTDSGECMVSAMKAYSGKALKDEIEFKKKKLIKLESDVCGIIKNTTISFESVSSLFEKGKVVFVFGAGLSISCGLPSWNELINKVADNIFGYEYYEDEIKSFLEHLKNDMNLAGLCEGLSTFIENEDFIEIVRDILYNKPLKDSTLINTLIDILVLEHKTNLNNNLSTVILTFNYDCIIEDNLRKRGIPYNSTTVIPLEIKIDEILIVHIHGRVFSKKTDDENVILTESSYGDLYLRNNIDPLSYVLNNGLIPFFIGFSFNDIFIRNILHSYKLKNKEFSALTVFAKNDLFDKKTIKIHPIEERAETINVLHGYKSTSEGYELEELRAKFANNIPSHINRKKFHSIGVVYNEVENYSQIATFLESTFLKK